MEKLGPHYCGYVNAFSSRKKEKFHNSFSRKILTDTLLLLIGQIYLPVFSIQMNFLFLFFSLSVITMKICIKRSKRLELYLYFSDDRTLEV